MADQPENKNSSGGDGGGEPPAQPSNTPDREVTVTVTVPGPLSHVDNMEDVLAAREEARDTPQPEEEDDDDEDDDINLGLGTGSNSMHEAISAGRIRDSLELERYQTAPDGTGGLRRARRANTDPTAAEGPQPARRDGYWNRENSLGEMTAQGQHPGLRGLKRKRAVTVSFPVEPVTVWGEEGASVSDTSDGTDVDTPDVTDDSTEEEDNGPKDEEEEEPTAGGVNTRGGGDNNNPAAARARPLEAAARGFKKLVRFLARKLDKKCFGGRFGWHRGSAAKGKGKAKAEAEEKGDDKASVQHIEYADAGESARGKKTRKR